MATVALCNYEFPPGCGGGGVFTADLAAALESRGHDVDLVVDDRDGPTSSWPSMLSYPVRSLPRAVQAAHDADVLNGHFAVPTSVLLPSVASLEETPLVVNCMGADVYDPTRYDRVRPLLDATLAHWVGRCADAVVVPSEDMAARVPERLADKTHVIPYFVDVDRFTFAPPNPGPPWRLLTVARLVERKHLALGLRALATLRARGVAATWTIAGTGPERERLERRARELGVADAVTFAGYVPDGELPDVYRDHDIFLLPSHHEAFGIAAVEAMAAGCPVVATDTGGHGEVAAPAGEAVPPTADTLADAIATITTDATRRAHAARERVLRRYTAEAVVPRYERLYFTVAA